MNPNLFHFATSELSQDAFICWLMSWAKPEYAQADPSLHKAGRRLLAAFFEKANMKLPEIESLDIKKQQENIDVLIFVNGKQYAIIIEDKIRSKNSNDQLPRYYSQLKRDGFAEQNIIPIYFKTWYQDNYEIGPFIPFVLDDLLDVLQTGDIPTHPIYQDFLSYQQSRHKEVESFNELPIGEWGSGWVGFFRELQKRWKTKTDWIGWKHINNRSGGFYGFYWSFYKPEHPWTENIHLLLKQYNGTAQVNFMIKVPEEAHRRDARQYWLDKILAACEKKGLTVQKVAKFGNGLHMSVAEWSEPVIRQNPNTGEVDFDYTLGILDKCQKVVEDIRKF